MTYLMNWRCCWKPRPYFTDLDKNCARNFFVRGKKKRLGNSRLSQHSAETSRMKILIQHIATIYIFHDFWCTSWRRRSQKSQINNVLFCWMGEKIPWILGKAYFWHIIMFVKNIGCAALTSLKANHFWHFRRWNFTFSALISFSRDLFGQLNPYFRSEIPYCYVPYL